LLDRLGPPQPALVALFGVAPAMGATAMVQLIGAQLTDCPASGLFPLQSREGYCTKRSDAAFHCASCCHWPHEPLPGLRYGCPGRRTCDSRLMCSTARSPIRSAAALPQPLARWHHCKYYQCQWEPAHCSFSCSSSMPLPAARRPGTRNFGSIEFFRPDAETSSYSIKRLISMPRHAHYNRMKLNAYV
jgi:hypothetical protein